MLNHRYCIVLNVLALYAVAREESRGKVLAFAHNSHLKHGKAEWQLGPELITWQPAGQLLAQRLRERYAVIGSAIGSSEDNGIGQPEDGTLENKLAAASRPMSFIPTFAGKGLSAEEITALPVRSGSKLNPTYFALTSQSITDFDRLAMVNESGYNRGGTPLQAWG
jgi:erythromycin esterase